MNNPTKVYIAAPWSKADSARKLKSILKTYDIDVISSWHGSSWEPVPDKSFHKREAETDKREIDLCDCVLVLRDPDKIGRGMYWELGYALGKGKSCFVFAFDENDYTCVFYNLDEIVKVHSVEEFVERVKALEEVVV